ncbi:hypothetical protein [Pseudomonas sp. efr-133-TYG-5]|uniref:hypothetical protein n=1 Tax=Pseudomonas sp. efr-133-TYG-5 TaxID=3040310 RepID=UPI002553F701|nr:hypothetical protein [Pseudomonas sp. efr-133-TYG-5]
MKVTTTAILFILMAGLGLGRAVLAADEFRDCMQEWEANTGARKTCNQVSNPSSGSVPMARPAGFRTCTITVSCQKSDGFPLFQKVDVDITQIPLLNNCGGRLKVGNC